MLLRHYLERGVSKAELSRRFGVSRRTIHRWVESGQLDLDLSSGVARYSPRLGAPLALNAEFLRFAAHWEFTPRSCRPYRAQTKGKVERPIRYVRESFFYGRTLVNDVDLNEQADRWVEGTANVRLHGTTRERPLDRFERDERQALRPLAPQPYRRLGGPPPAPEAPRPAVAPTVQVQRRSLREYSEAVR